MPSNPGPSHTDYDVHDMAALLIVAAQALPYTSAMELRPVRQADPDAINQMSRTQLIQFVERALIQIHGYDDAIRNELDLSKTRFG
jgi:hypothetical protein